VAEQSRGDRADRARPWWRATSRRLTWHDRAEFELGALYVSDDGDVTLEYVGCVTADAAERINAGYLPDVIDAESDRLAPVMLFREVAEPDAEWFWTHTRRDSELGFTLQPLADRVRDEGDDGGPSSDGD
jgi:hypothetical protein